MKKLNALLAIVPVCTAVVCAVYFWYEYGLISLAFDAAIILFLPFASLFHELGHILFGALVGIKAVPKLKLFGSSSCKIIPKTYKNLRPKVFFTAMGGIIVNVLFVITGIVALCVRGCPSWLAVVMPTSVWLYLINIVPVRYSGGKTDGLILFEIAKNDDTAKVMLAVLSVQAQVLRGKPIQEIDENLLFGVPQIAEDEEAFIALTELRYEYFNAKGDGQQAEKYRLRFEELKNEYM